MPIQPGGQISASEYNRNEAFLARLQRVKGIAGLRTGPTIRLGPDGLEADSTVYQPFWVKITGKVVDSNGRTAYTWQEQFQFPAGAPINHESGRNDGGGGILAYEWSGFTQVPIGSYVLLWLGYDSQTYYTFTWPFSPFLCLPFVSSTLMEVCFGPTTSPTYDDITVKNTFILPTAPPASPTDGGIWVTGCHINYRCGGVTYTTVQPSEAASPGSAGSPLDRSGTTTGAMTTILDITSGSTLIARIDLKNTDGSHGLDYQYVLYDRYGNVRASGGPSFVGPGAHAQLSIDDLASGALGEFVLQVVDDVVGNHATWEIKGGQVS